jgi:hypothetical protein
MNQRTKDYLDAVDVVCVECAGEEEDCATCWVRKTCDMVHAGSLEDNATDKTK